MTFPLFRRFLGGSSYFKVDDEENWVELKKRPDSSFELYRFKVNNFADRNHISDIIRCDETYYEEISKEEYLRIEANLADLSE